MQDKPRFDKSTYWGRFQHFLTTTNPLNLLATDQQIKESQELLRKEKNGEIKVDQQKIWEAKQIVESALHPQEGNKIFLPFRFSAFVPANTIICLGLLWPNPSTATVIAWQFINQSYNVAVNHANRNTSNEMSYSDIGIAYLTATAASISVALGTGYLARKLFSPQIQKIALPLVPFIAVSAASVLNVFLMRRNEISEGIELKDERGIEYGKSKVAGLEAVKLTAFSRIMWCIPILTFPPFFLNMLMKTKFLKSNPKFEIPINLTLITIALYYGVPAAIAIFPEISEIESSKLEEKYRNLKDSQNQPITKFYYYRGL